MSNFVRKHKYLFLLILLHLLGIFFIYEGPQFFNKNPVYNYDYPFHLYHCYEAQKYYSTGNSWGYNPFLLAGYPSGIVIDNELLQLICSLFSFQTQIIILKIWITLILFLLPVLVYSSSLNFGFNKRTAITSTVILLLYLYHDYFINSAIYYGLFNFIFSSILSVFYLSLFCRYMLKKEKKIAIFLFATFPLIFLVHISIWLLFLIPFFLMYFIHVKKLSLKHNLIIIAIVAITLLTSIFWIISPLLIQIVPYNIETAQVFQIENLKQFVSDFYYRSNDINPGLQFVKSLIIIIGFIGILQWGYKNKLFYVFLITTLMLFTITYLHNLEIFNFISNIQPYKFIIPLIFFLIIPCGNFINNLLKKIKFSKPYDFKTIISILLILFIIFQIINVQFFNQPKRKLQTVPPEDYLILKEWLKENTNNQGRILFESELLKMFDKHSIIYGLLSLETKREILGGPHVFLTRKHSFPSLTKDKIFKKEWNLSDEELFDYLELYNVGWIVVNSEVPKQQLYNRYKQNDSFFKNRSRILPQFYEGEKYHQFHIYKVNRDLNFIIGGTGDVTIDFNIIKIENLEIENKDIILKYHWHPTLKTRPEFRLEPVYLLDDPIPFIKVFGVNTTGFEVYNSYQD